MQQAVTWVRAGALAATSIVLSPACAPGSIRAETVGGDGADEGVEETEDQDAWSDEDPEEREEAAPQTGTFGSLQYETRDIGPGGLGAVRPAPLAGVTVELVSANGAVVDATVTNEDGSFELATEIDGGSLQVAALWSGPAGQLTVSDQSGAEYEWAAAVLPRVTNDFVIGEADSSGAASILATCGRGLLFAHEHLAGQGMPDVDVFWERGRTTPGGTSYQAWGADGVQVELWILGGPGDTDEYDESVLLHELGHALQVTHGWTYLIDGNAHDGVDTDPRLAWSEGSATLFGQVVLGDPLYLDSLEDGAAAFGVDLDNLDPSAFASPSAGMQQTLHEDLVSATGWKLFQLSGEGAGGADPIFSVLREWISPGFDRAASGADLVDFLDGHLCLNGSGDERALRTSLSDEWGFPYDFAPQCKPGRGRVTASVEEICASGPADVLCSLSLGPGGLGPLSATESIQIRDGRRVHRIELGRAEP